MYYLNIRNELSIAMIAYTFYVYHILQYMSVHITLYYYDLYVRNVILIEEK